MKAPDYIVTDKCLTIRDSFRVVSSQQMVEMLDIIRKEAADGYNPVLENRTNRSFVKEWLCHNLAYRLRLFRTHSKDCDMEYPQVWYQKVVWQVLGEVMLWLE